MSEYQVQTIEAEVKKTVNNLNRQKKKNPEGTMTVTFDGMLAYCKKVGFLCKEIKTLKSKLNK